MGDHPPKSSTPASGAGANHPAPTPRPSSSNVLPNSSPSNPNESPESNNTKNSNPSNPPAASPSPTSPTSPVGTGPSARGHHRIGSSSTNTSNYPSWLPRRPPPPEPPGSTVGGMTTRPSTRAGFDSPDDDMGEFDWELVVGPEAAREEALNSSDGEDAPRTSREQRRHTHGGLPTATPSQPIAPKGERKPTPRSVRIVSVPGGPHQQASSSGPSSRTRDTSEGTRVPSGSAPPPVVGSGSRAFSRATGSALVSPTLISSFPSRGGTAGAKTRYSRTGRSSTLPPMAIHMMQNPGAAAVQPPPVGPHPIQHLRPPRFRTPKFHPTLLRDPTLLTRVRFYLWGLFVVFGHIVLQSFLDFNIVYMMVQVAKHPTPSPLGTSSSQRNWTLATVAYIASWVIWLFGVVLLYESIFCFWRRWRVKRPLVIPIYLSSAAFNLVSLTSYTNFCFLQHIRWSALGEYNTVTDESELGSLARRKPVEQKPVEKPAEEQQHQTEGDDGEGHRVEKSPVEQHRQEGGAVEAEHAEGGEPRQENPHSESSISYSTPSNGNGVGTDPHQSTPESVKRNSGGAATNGNGGKHQRQFSQARTVSSAPSKGRFSEGVESSDGIALSEGRPQISELASDHEDEEEEIVSALDAKRQRAEDLHRATETTIPIPRTLAPRGADGSAFFEHRMSYSSTVSSSSSVGSSRFGNRNVFQFIAETCWFYSQNMPTIITLLPRLALTLALYLAFVGPSTGATLGSNNSLGRDGTFFGGHGELSGYAKVIVWLQIAWGLWRSIVLLGSWIGLWLLSGLGCAGLCGPRYRWEEMPSGLEDEDSPLPYLRRYEEKRREVTLAVPGDEQREPHAYNSRRHSRIAENRLSSFTIADQRFSDRTGRRAFSDPDDHTLNWSWMERCRDRIWDTWEFCLTRSGNAQRGEDQHDAYWHAWRSAGVPHADPHAREMLEKQYLQPGSVPVPGTSGSGLAPASPGYNSSMTAVGTPLPFSSLTASSAGYGVMGLPAYQAGAAGYGQMDTMLSTLQEMSSNPSLAAPSSGVSPATVPQPLPIFAPQAPRRGILREELFTPLPETTSTPAKPDDGAWLGSNAVPLAGPQSGAAAALPYPFPAYSSSQQSPKTNLPFPLAPVVVANEQSVIQVPPASRHPANVFPTPAPTIQSLPFPVPRSGASSVGMSPGRQPQEELVEYYDDAEHGMLSHVRSQIGSQGTGSMSSLGQPIQSRYPVGYRRARGRRSSASASGSGVVSSHRVSDASASGLGSQQRSPRDSFISGSGSGSGYGSQAMVRSQRSRISGASNGYVEGEADYAEEVSLGSRISSPVGPGMAGVGAGGGLGPRGSLLNLGSQPQSPLEEYTLDPPPRHPSGGRRRAGTLPSPSAPGFVPPPIVPPVPGQVGSVRSRLVSAPDQPSSSTREYFAPMPGHDIDMPAFAQALGLDDDEFGGSQEEAEQEDSVGLLSQAPSRRSSASGLNLRSRASQISLHRRGNTSRPVSVTSPTHQSAAAVRSRATSLLNRQAAESRESLHSGSRGSLAVPEARSRTGSDAGRRTSQYSDARSRTHSGTGSHLEGSVESAGPGPGHDMTFGVQVDWQRPDASAMAEAQGERGPANERTSGPGLASASRASLQVPGPSTRSRPIDINVPAGSRADLSSANASFVTALPSVAASTTDTVGISEGSSERTWERGRSNRYFLEGGPGAVGPR
ncbi:hypothetical protein M407DRAFT_214369 [Tulasnella calospora MUT 4182]|uniref:Uncharacterized protein n=1 Tax=Tulasnella calospora MUT 4182 TaxID=1051891 RepID=A0A0C3MF98_9AGAM|nr:hypothetical protein M407DRAFT_214369 [Tulasnella calospora MUT 4182]